MSKALAPWPLMVAVLGGAALAQPSWVLRNASAQSSAPPASQPALEPAEGPAMEIFYTGHTGGVSGQSGSGATILQLWRYLSERQGEAVLDRTGQGVLRHGNRIIIDPEAFKTAPTLELISKGPRFGSVKTTTLSALQGDKILFFQYPLNPRLDLLEILEQENRRSGQDPSLHRVQITISELQTQHGKRILAIDQGSTLPVEMPQDPRQWEIRWGGRGGATLGNQQANYFLLMRPYASGDRRVQLIKDLLLRSPANRHSLILSGGNEIDDWDSSTGKISRFRDLDLRTLADLSYTAIVPGRRELYFGAQHLNKEAQRYQLPLVATNMVFARGKTKGKSVFHRYLLRNFHGIKIAILGLVDPGVTEQVQSPAVLAEVQIVDPLSEANQVIMELNRLPAAKQPHLVIAVSNLQGKPKEAFLKECFGIDIFIGDFSQLGLYAASERLQVKRRSRESFLFRYPLIQTHGSYARVGQIRARFRLGQRRLKLVELFHDQHGIHNDLPRDEALHRRIMSLVLQDLPQLESVLIPSLERIVAHDKALLRLIHDDPEFTRIYPRGRSEKWQIWFTPHLWSNVLANLLRHAARAEIALIRATTHLNYNTPGPVLEDYVLNWLSTNEFVELYEFTGAQLRTLSKSGLDGLVFTGLDLGSMKVGGRALADDEWYTVVMGRAAAESPAIVKMLQGITPVRTFLLEGDRLVPSKSGKVTRLREVALAVLKALRRADPTFGPTYRARLRSWLQPLGVDLVPRWTIHADHLTFSFSSYGNYPKESYTQNPGVRETRVGMPNHYSLSVNGTIAAAYDARKVTWENRILFKLSQQMITLRGDDGADQRTTVKMADDLLFSTELRLKIFELPLGAKPRLQLIPYTNVTFDTEFTPTTSMMTGETYPHQKDLISSIGLVTFPGQVVQELRLAGVLRTDFAAANEVIDGGLMLGTKLVVPLWLARLRLGGTLFFYPDTTRDTFDKLGLILQGTANLDVPFTRDLKVTLGADLFLYRAKVRRFTDPEGKEIERDIAASMILSAGVAFDHLWKI